MQQGVKETRVFLARPGLRRNRTSRLQDRNRFGDRVERTFDREVGGRRKLAVLVAVVPAVAVAVGARIAVVAVAAAAARDGSEDDVACPVVGLAGDD